MNRPRIFVTQPIAKAALDRIAEIADVAVNPDASKPLPKEKLIDAVREADILFSLLHDVVDRDVIEANPQLQLVASQSITPDRIDTAAATERGVPVTLVPPIVTEATADIAFGLLLSLARRIVEGDHLVRQGIFPGGQSAYLLGGDVTGKIIGLVGGRGRIGKAVAKRAQGFDMRVLYWGRGRMSKDEEAETGMEFCDLDELLHVSDFVSVHSSLTDENRHLLDRREFMIMKSSAYLINTARGPIVNEAALAEALQAGEIAGAGLDVFEQEPFIHPALLKQKNVVLTPHLGSAARQVRERMAGIVVDNIIAFVEGRPLPNCVNPGTLEGRVQNNIESIPG